MLRNDPLITGRESPLPEQIRLEQVNLLISAVPIAVVTNIALGIILAWVQKAVINIDVITIWFVALLAVSVFRIGVYFLYRRNVTLNWKAWFDAGVFLNGAAWALAAVLLFPQTEVVYQLFLSLVIVGVIVGAVVSLFPSMFSLALFTLPAGLAVVVKLFAAGTDVSVAVAIMGFLFCAIMIVNGRRLNRNTTQNISLRLQTESQQTRLRESEDKLRLIVENVGDALFVHDDRGQFLDVNPYACDSLGYSREELLHMNVKDVEINSGDDNLQQGWQDMPQKAPVRLTGCHRRKDGSEFPVEVSLCKYMQDEQSVFLAVVRDVSLNKRYEEALKFSEERIHAQFRAIPVPTYTWQRQGQDFVLTNANDAAFVYTDDRIKKYFGTKASDLHSDDPRILEYFERCMREKKSISRELSFCFGKDGDRVLDVKFAYVPPDLVMVHAEDITERKRSELALTSNREMLNQAQHIARFGHWTMDKLSGEVQWSDALYELLGLAPGDREAGTELFFRYVHPDDAAVLKRNMEMLFARDECPDMELRVIHEDGSQHTLFSSVKALTEKDGKAITYIGTLQDISEAKSQQQMLIDAKEEADTANRAKSDFLSRMSHELRTPMNAILGFAQLFEMDKTISETQKRNIEEISRAGELLLGLINEVLDLSRIESGGMEISVEEVSVESVLDECETLIHPLAKKRGVKIRRSDIDFHDEPVLADRSRLKQVLLNLLSNAIKYNRDGGLVSISCRIENEERIKVSITDTGGGISAKNMKMLFTPFQRLGRENTDIEGTGIGLVIAKKLLELMGGNIFVESKIGEGSVFSFQLPLAFGSVEMDGSAIRKKLSPENVSLSQAWSRILYIEDNPASIRLMENILMHYPGVELLSAPEPFLGIELAQAHQPDLILLDINLPGLDGYGVLRKLQEDSATAHIPVVALTADVLPKNIENGKKAGFFEYLTKPMDVGVLMQTIERVLSGKRGEKGLELPAEERVLNFPKR